MRRLVTKELGARFLQIASYRYWIADIASIGDRSEIRVKPADNEDDRDSARVAALACASKIVATRYWPARRLLEDRPGKSRQ